MWLRLQRLVQVEQGELPALLWSFAYFFALLCGYYILRPMRDEMGIVGGIQHLQWLFTGTFLSMLAAVPLFGWITARYPRRRFLPLIYYFFIANLMLFYLLFRSSLPLAYVARAFFIWVSVFNLFIVSVFWSFMADIFSNAQAKRLFGFIAAGGTAGALAGPALTAALAVRLGPANLLPLSALFLGCAVVCIKRLGTWKEKSSAAPPPQTSIAVNPASLPSAQEPMGGTILAGIRLVAGSRYLIGICLLILFFTSLSTFLYFQQAWIIGGHFTDSAQRTAVFAGIDLAVNSLTIIIQLLLTGRVVKILGLEWSLALIPLLMGLGFLILGWIAAPAVLIVLQVVRRAGNYAIMKPGREMLFVVLGREEKYKAKSFIDTVVYRGGDAVSAWIYAGLQTLGLTLSAMAFMAAPLAVIWAGISLKLGKMQQEKAGR